MWPQAASLGGPKLLVYEALSFYCMRPYATSVGALSYYYAEACGANASETQEIAGNVETKHGEKMQEDARKCGDLLLVAEAMLEIVNNYNRESFPPLGVRIGALCCVFRVPSYCRTHWSTFPIAILILISSRI